MFVGATRLLAAAGLAAAVPDMASAQTKIEQKVAGYQDQPHGTSKCSGCLHFTAPNTCQIVDGQISPDGWCKLFAPKG
jgi:hypothetical protein